MSADFIHKFAPGTNGRAFLLLHGTGGDEDDMPGFGRAIDPHAALLSPRGQVNENGSNRFFRRLAEGVFDEEDVVRRSHELAQFVSEAIDKYGIEAGKLTAIGYSNGANVAAAMMLLGVAPFSTAILFRAMVPLTNTEIIGKHEGRVLISEGQADPIAPPAGGHDLAKLLRETGRDVDLVVQAAGHQLIHDDVIAAQRWLESL